MLMGEDIKGIKTTLEISERRMRDLSKQIDRFLAAEIDLTGTLVQVREVVRASRDELYDLRGEVRRLDKTIHGTLALAAGDPGANERERNGN
jgi:transposase